MSSSDDLRFPFSLLQFYATAPYPCSYLQDHEARSQMAIPAYLIDKPVYSQLIRMGFRRSGLFTYRPWCDGCHACVPTRLPVDRMALSRSQRRSLKRHLRLDARERPLLFDEQHYALYLRYQTRRHPGGGMDAESREQYAQFILESQMDTRLIEFSEDGCVRMVSVIDMLDDGMSSVYTFFDPDIPGAAYGTYNILWQACLCAQQDLPYLYLGYWIRECGKMAYKSRFRPLQGYLEGVWRDLADSELEPLP
jgi:arginine-tRNA-protein transferase